ncbi:MAG TPA: hypothetical protein VGD78_10610 [Chthoniobacterales bacterium]
MRFDPRGSDAIALQGILDGFTAEHFRRLRGFAQVTGLSLFETLECLWAEVQKKRATRSTDGEPNWPIR